MIIGGRRNSNETRRPPVVSATFAGTALACGVMPELLINAALAGRIEQAPPPPRSDGTSETTFWALILRANLVF